MSGELTEFLGHLMEGGALRVGEVEVCSRPDAQLRATRHLSAPREVGTRGAASLPPLVEHAGATAEGLAQSSADADAGEEGFEMRHVEDAGRADLELFERYEAAREIALHDEEGAFRPLKTAPNLRRGWLLRLATLREVHLALDYFYPAMLGVWRDHEAGRLAVAPLRETLGRQSGMYAVTKKISDEEAQAMIGDFCRSDRGCLKRILWEISPGVPVTTLPPEKFSAARRVGELPLLCHEACNLLVGKAREVVKAARAQ